MGKVVVPYRDKNSSKKEQVAQMFDNIAPRYDFLNRFLSAGIDVQWRKKAVELLKKYEPTYILDVATGTADFALQLEASLHPTKVIGVDISENMLAKGREKIRKRQLVEKIELRFGDSEQLLFEDNTFDAITVAFGVRNFENLQKGLAEMYRVLQPKGVVVILEFSKPSKFPMKQLYNFYFRNILPTLGGWLSKDSSAYQYLPDSVAAFPDGKNFLGVLEKTGFINTICIPLTFGISSIYLAQKPA